jgi:hypothetical protein
MVGPVELDFVAAVDNENENAVNDVDDRIYRQKMKVIPDGKECDVALRIFHRPWLPANEGQDFLAGIVLLLQFLITACLGP